MALIISTTAFGAFKIYEASFKIDNRPINKSQIGLEKTVDTEESNPKSKENMELYSLAYDMMLKTIKTKTSRLKLELDDSYYIKIIDYDKMFSSLDVVVSNEHNDYMLKFDVSYEEFSEAWENENLPYTKFSDVNILISKNSFKVMPQKLNKIENSDDTITLKTNETFSEDYNRDENLKIPNISKNENYYYFVEYTSADNNEFTKNITAKSETNYEILELENLVEFVDNDINNENLIKIEEANIGNLTLNEQANLTIDNET